MREGEQVVIRALESGEEAAACRVILDSFHQYEAEGYSQQGIDSFTDYASPDAMARRLATDHFALGAFDENVLVGVIEMRELRHVSQLFVAGAHHRRGIARRLWQRALAICRERQPELELVTVNSSRYAVAVYQRLGFVATGPEAVDDGIRFTPMVLEVAAGKER